MKMNEQLEDAWPVYSDICTIKLYYSIMFTNVVSYNWIEHFLYSVDVWAEISYFLTTKKLWEEQVFFGKISLSIFYSFYFAVYIKMRDGGSVYFVQARNCNHCNVEWKLLIW